MAQKKGKTPEDFWREYEEQTGEKVIARSLGQYVSGWDEFDNVSGTPMWGLIIATSGGFRFHHFPQSNWFSALARIGSLDDPPKEKTVFIPTSRIVSVVLHKETKWYRKIFSPGTHLEIRYCNEAGDERKLLLQADHKPEGIAQALAPSS